MSLFLHAQRIDVLHALALVAGGREALPDGLERLAAGDPLLAPWARRLAPPLRQGEPLPEVLRRARLVSRAEGIVLAAEDDAAAGLARLAETAAAPPRGLLLVRWFPTALVAVASAGSAVGMLATLPMSGVVRDLGIRSGPIESSFLGLAMAILSVFMIQSVLLRMRGLRHLQHLWCPAVHRAAAWRDFVEAVRVGDEPVRLGRVASLMCATGLLASRSRAPAWDQPWRTWLMLSRFLIPRPLRRRLAAEPSGRIRLELLGGADRAVCDAELRQVIAAVWPLLTAALWVVGVAGFIIGLMTGPFLSLFYIVEQLNGG